jgi:hypothetical protein
MALVLNSLYLYTIGCSGLSRYNRYQPGGFSIAYIFSLILSKGRNCHFDSGYKRLNPYRYSIYDS